jgi:hypothetical protein
MDLFFEMTPSPSYSRGTWLDLAAEPHRAILLTLLDTMARVSEPAGVKSRVDLEGRVGQGPG